MRPGQEPHPAEGPPTIPVAAIRHGPTDWNEQRRIQGRADRPLTPAGRETVSGWRLPAELVAYDWYVSPLSRARETAALLGLDPAVEPALIEMDWGAWDGARGAELRARYGEAFERELARGLDMHPHGGETPRALRARVAQWLDRVRLAGRPAGAVCHQGVIRALLSLATGWDMIAKPPVELEWSAVQIFALAADGAVALQRANVMLDDGQPLPRSKA